MRAPKAVLDNWRKKHFGPRVQASVIAYLLEKVDYFEQLNIVVPLDRLFHDCFLKFGVSKSTSRRWWCSYKKYGELPYETIAFNRTLQKKYKWLSSRANITEEELQVLKGIIDSRPDLYLDEIAVAFGMETGKFINHSSLWRYITRYLDYSLQTLTKKASQQCEVARSSVMIVLLFTLTAQAKKEDYFANKVISKIKEINHSLSDTSSVKHGAALRGFSRIDSRTLTNVEA